MAKFSFTRYDFNEWGDTATLKKEIPETDKNLILSLTEEQLKNLARKNIVGKANTVCGNLSYYANPVQLGGFKLSIQANYPVWKKRNENGTPHETPITEEEFDNVKMFDVEITHGKTTVVQPGQMTIPQIVNLLKWGLK